MKNLLQKNNGITLIALVITIIVLLILAGVTVASLAGNNGLINRADTAREESIIAKEKDQIAMACNSAKVASLGEEITQSLLQTELNTIVNDDTVIVIGSGPFRVHFNGTNHNYNVVTTTEIITKVADGDAQQRLQLRYTIKNEEYESQNGTEHGNFLYVTPYVDGITVIEYEEYAANKLETENKTSLFIDSYNYLSGESYTTITQVAEEIIGSYDYNDISMASSITSVEDLFTLLCNRYGIGAEYNNSVNEWLIKNQYVDLEGYEDYLLATGGSVQISALGGINSEAEILLERETIIAETEYVEGEEIETEWGSYYEDGEEYLIPMPSNKLIQITATASDR